MRQHYSELLWEDTAASPSPELRTDTGFVRPSLDIALKNLAFK